MYNKRLIHNILIFVPVTLVIMGICMVYSASCINAAERFNDGTLFLKKQVIFAIAGIIGMLLIMRVPYRQYRRFAYPFLLISVALLLAVFIPGVGKKAGGACRWLGFSLFSFQPSEFAKLAVIIFLSYFFDRRAAPSHGGAADCRPGAAAAGFRNCHNIYSAPVCVSVCCRRSPELSCFSDCACNRRCAAAGYV
jgi:cell division protein FtsW (lipid II flippase)